MTAGHAGMQHPVAIVGAGPTGLALALGLARHGVRSVLLERHSGTGTESRAAGIHVRTLEIFRQWQVEDAVREAGILRSRLSLHDAAGGRALIAIDFAELDDEADRPGVLFLEQSVTERLLLEAVRDAGLCDVRFGTEVVTLTPETRGARIGVRAGDAVETITAEFVVGCDGAGSFIRGALSLPFDGITYAVRPVLADVRVTGARDRLPWPRARNRKDGLAVAFRLASGLWRIVALERAVPEDGDDVPDAWLGDRVTEVLGPGPFETVWSSRFRIHRRSAPVFRVGRVLLAGDAAHVHSPAGGLGMNAGIQDAHNLAWKLAAARQGGDLDCLLDSYDVERRAVVVEDISRTTDTMTRVFLQTPGSVRASLVLLVRLMSGIRWVRRRGMRRAAMIDLDYLSSPMLPEGLRHAGRRLPNVRLSAGDGSAVRLYHLLPCGPLVVAISDDASAVTGLPVGDVVRIGADAYSDPSGRLRRLAAGPDGWILVRPDAHVAGVTRKKSDLVAMASRTLERGRAAEEEQVLVARDPHGG